MNRYETTFDRLKRAGEAAFIPFAVAGDPDLDMSEAIFRAYVDGGADILEIGYPFSDPIADGPVNQRAAMRAVGSGLDHRSFFDLVSRLRAYTDIPFGVLLYTNTVLHLGYEEFCRKAARAGIDSILAADMPPEESGEFSAAMKKYGIGRVFIVSELTPEERMNYICDNIDAFVYVVSRLGTTGTGESLDSNVKNTLRRLKKATARPLAVGFGLSTPGHVKTVCREGADGAIVGSALVSVIEANCDGNKQNISRILREMVEKFKVATRSKAD